MEAAGVELSGEHDFTLAATSPEEELEGQTLGNGARSEQLAQFFSGVGFDFRLGIFRPQTNHQNLRLRHREGGAQWAIRPEINKPAENAQQLDQ